MTIDASARQRIGPPDVCASDRPDSPALKVGNVLFISGQVSADLAGEPVGIGDIRVQTRTVSASIGRLLAAAGGGFEHPEI